MSKYDELWKYVSKREETTFKLSYDEIEKISGVAIDHSFLNAKKELLAYGYRVGKISLKEKNVEFVKET